MSVCARLRCVVWTAVVMVTHDSLLAMRKRDGSIVMTPTGGTAGAAGARSVSLAEFDGFFSFFYRDDRLVKLKQCAHFSESDLNFEKKIKFQSVVAKV